jgi:sarcosine oxidase subunit beta
MNAFGTAVIGAGSLGLFTALELARRGEAVVVLDKGVPMREASGVNAGSLGVQNKLLPLVPMTMRALEAWSNAGALVGADVGYRRVGGLRLATSEAEVAQLRKGFEAQRQVGVKLEWLDRADVRQRAPYLSDDIAAATYCDADSIADPLRLAPALVGAARAAGIDLRGNTEVRAIRAEGGGFAIDVDGATVRSKRLLVAAGAWSASLCAHLGLRIPVALDVNIVSVTEPRPALISEVVTHVRGILTLKQVTNGTILIGGGWQGHGELGSGEKSVTYESSVHNIRLATRMIPSLRHALLVRQWAGFEGVSPDSLPYAGAIPGVSGAYVLACARGGWTLAPELGRLMSALMLGHGTGAELDAFRPERHAHL